MRIRYGRSVRADLIAIRTYGVDTWGLSKTLAYLAGFEDKLERLIESPRMGRPREELSQGLRSLRYRRHHVFYTLERDEVLIVAVLHERRDHSAIDFADRLEGE